MEKHQFEEKISHYIVFNSLLADNDKVIVTLSGGADSVALLLVLKRLEYDIIALHCNFHLRGEESNRDEAFVRQLCEKLDISLIVKDFDVASYQNTYHVSTEMACRELRYEWFEKMRISLVAQAIAVAHHSDDNIETFFLNAFRGSGVAGLSGIKQRNGKIIRPLLCVNRNEIEKYLQICSQSYVVDSTNAQCDYKRNKVRNQILPIIKDLFPDAESGLIRTLHDMSGCFDLYQSLIEDMKSKVLAFHPENNSITLYMTELEKIHNGLSTALYEILKDYGFNSAQVADILESYKSNDFISGKKFITSSHVAVFNRNVLEIALLSSITSEGEYTVTLDKKISFPVPINIEIINRDSNKNFFTGLDGKNTIALNLDVINAPHTIILRHWKQSDRIKPFGMKGSKLVSDIFTDAKLSEIQKRQTWLLTIDDDIVWILGMRASSHFSVSHDSLSYLRLSLT